MHGNLGGFVQNYVLYSVKGFALFHLDTCKAFVS